eukprot:Gb_25454 [translate_table: standard]
MAVVVERITLVHFSSLPKEKSKKELGQSFMHFQGMLTCGWIGVVERDFPFKMINLRFREPSFCGKRTDTSLWSVGDPLSVKNHVEIMLSVGPTLHVRIGDFTHALHSHNSKARKLHIVHPREAGVVTWRNTAMDMLESQMR